MNETTFYIPEEMKSRRSWVLWKLETDKKGRQTKIPYSAAYHGKASSTNPASWTSYTEAKQALDEGDGQYNGTGFVLTGDGLVFIDIDHCIKDGELSETAQDIIHTIGATFAEISQSGSGVHLFAHGKIPRSFKNSANGVEMYDVGRYCAITGNAVCRDPIADNQEGIDAVFEKYKTADAPPKRDIRPIALSRLSDAEIVEKCRKHGSGLFDKLYAGDASMYGSRSEADFALCLLLTFWADGDPDTIDRIFRSSGLMRDKWNRDDYRNRTIERALSMCDETISEYRQRKHQEAGSMPDASSGVPNELETLEPSDYTDLGQANAFLKKYGNTIRYSKGPGFLVFNGKVWDESDIKAQGLSQDFTDDQLEGACKKVRKAQDALNEIVESNADSVIDPLDSKNAMKEAKKVLERAEKYRSYVLGRRKSNKIAATLTEVRPKVEIDVSQLDADGFLLNTQSGTSDLRTGEIRMHDPRDYCTKMTAVAPDEKNREMFEEFIDRVTVGDKELARYLQEIAGMCIIGKVLWECLIIWIGDGGNGKSTLGNLLARVLGDYAGSLSAETLTANCRKNKSPEYAELRGKRLIIAAELEEGMRLDTSVVKKLCSTDPILAEKKYKDPFTFTPSHTIVLYTNHLPKIGTTDKGTWDRIIVVPFMARFRGESGEVKNYADYLFEHCGGAVLTWMIEGARRFIENNYSIEQPECVKAAIADYRSDNDWLRMFLDECCEVDPTYTQQAGDLLKRYRSYCDSTGEYCRNQVDFKQALTAAGYDTHKTNKGAFVYGLKLKDNISDILNRQKGSTSQTA